MSVTEFNRTGLTRITEAQFGELTRIGGAPHDLMEEEGCLGVAFARGGNVVQAWHIEGDGHFLQTPDNFPAARQILAP